MGAPRTEDHAPIEELPLRDLQTSPCALRMREISHNTDAMVQNTCGGVMSKFLTRSIWRALASHGAEEPCDHIKEDENGSLACR